MVDHVVEGDLQGVFVALDDHPEAVVDQHHVGASLIDETRHRGVIGGDHGDLLAGLHLLKVRTVLLDMVGYLLEGGPGRRAPSRPQVVQGQGTRRSARHAGRGFAEPTPDANERTTGFSDRRSGGSGTSRAARTMKLLGY